MVGASRSALASITCYSIVPLLSLRLSSTLQSRAWCVQLQTSFFIQWNELILYKYIWIHFVSLRCVNKWVVEFIVVNFYINNYVFSCTKLVLLVFRRCGLLLKSWTPMGSYGTACSKTRLSMLKASMSRSSTALTEILKR